MTPIAEMSTIEKFDNALEAVFIRRDSLLRQPPTKRRARKLAELYRLEAQLWSAVFEEASDRLTWRAALAAAAHARACAGTWMQRSCDQPCEAPATHAGGAR